MKYSNKIVTVLLISIGLTLSVFSACKMDNSSARYVEDFNFDWKFHLGDLPEASKVGFDASAWHNVRLPHDWSVEHSFTQESTDGATAFLPGGIAWYHKTFTIPKSSANKITWIEFDGIYTNSEVWINGHYLGKRPFGYAPFSYDLTDFLKYGGENELAVRVDRSAYADSRWYPGSGIYRNVKLVSTSKTHIPQWGVFVSTPKVESSTAHVEVLTKLVVDSNLTFSNMELRTTVYDGERLLNQMSKEVLVSETNGQLIKTVLTVDEPKLWDVDMPYMYTALSEVLIDGKVVDDQVTRFGIRTFAFDAEKGFYLNGVNTLLKGVCLHHDGGLVGAAVPRGVWERRLKALKHSGCNAIRTAHNPPSEEFLDLCDELGFLVQVEVFDEFQNPKDKRKNYNQSSDDAESRGYSFHFDEWAERDLKNVIERDRNHPSVIMWSIGNEIEWTFPTYGNATGYWGSNKVGDVNYYWDEPPFSPKQIQEIFEAEGAQDICAQTARQLSAWVKEVDATRPVTANLVIPSVSMFSGYADALDVVGLSYRQVVYDYCRRHYPEKVILGTENWTRYHEWVPVVNRPYMSGIFLWTGINYMGESRKWPVRGSGSGLLDFAGFKKPSYYFFSTLWNDAPQVYIYTQTTLKSSYKWEDENQSVVEKESGWAQHQKWGWQDVNTHWNYAPNDSIIVEVYTNQSEVELFLNQESLGVRALADVDDHILKWMVPYAEGALKAVAVNGMASHLISSSGALNGVAIRVDKDTLKANYYDVAHITVQLEDKNGIPVMDMEKEIIFSIEGPAMLLGVDNGSPTSVQDYQSNKIITSNGKALLLIQSMNKKGSVTISASVASEDMREGTVSIRIQ